MLSFNNFHSLRQKLRFVFRMSVYGVNPIKYFKYLPSATAANGERALYYSPPREDGSLPVPPQDLWLGYGKIESEYVDSGRQDVERMTSVLASCGMDMSCNTRPVLDLGCGGGRMIRHLHPHASRAETWGLDISAPHINWLKTHLSPPFYFAVNTTIPHLPFPDGYFNLVYCGSLFTHIDDLAETWFLEIRRTLLSGGLLYCTLHDDHALAALNKQPWHPLAKTVQKTVLRDRPATAPDIIIHGNDSDSNVFYQSRYLKTLLSRLFEIRAVVPSAYGYQTAWVLAKRL